MEGESRTIRTQAAAAAGVEDISAILSQSGAVANSSIITETPI